MLESVLIQNFKGFKNTLISPFRKVNLIICSNCTWRKRGNGFSPKRRK